MMYRLLADGVVLLHVAFIGFVLFGGLLAFQWRRAPWFHLPAAAWGVAVELFGWFCPLTPLENQLRRAGGGGDYAGSFVERYLLPVIYPADLTRELQILLAVLVAVLNAGIYVAVWRRWRQQAG